MGESEDSSFDAWINAARVTRAMKESSLEPPAYDDATFGIETNRVFTV